MVPVTPGPHRTGPPARAEAAARDALRDVAALEGFFTLTTDPAEAVDPSWRPVDALLGEGSRVRRGPLDRRIDEVAEGLAAPRRIAASLLANSVSTRFVSLLLAAAVEHHLLPDLAHDRLHWRPWSGGPLPLWIADARGRALGAPDDPATAAAVADELAEVHLRPLVETVRAVVSVSATTLWGNAASGLAGAVRVLALSRPRTLAPSLALARGVLARAPFDGLGGFVDEPDHPTGVGFRRRSCCLYYRIPGGDLCGDCVLVRPTAARPAAAGSRRAGRPARRARTGRSTDERGAR